MATAALILANRAYLDHEAPRGAPQPSTAANGGLLAAVRPAIAPWDGHEGTTWIGAGRGTRDREWVDPEGFELIPSTRGPVCHRRLFFDDETWAGHYGTVANSFLWPLLHLVREALPGRTEYFPAPVTPSEGEWERYRAVNAEFATAGSAEVRHRTAWVHDYQLALVPAMLRKRAFAGRIGFFLHTPFPDLRVAAPFLTADGLGYFREFVAGILGAGLAGFQSGADVERFSYAAGELCGAKEEGDALRFEGRLVALGAYPVGVDTGEILAICEDAPAPASLASALSSGLPLVVGLERADFTKGIPERLRAVAAAYRGGARFAYVGIAAPTRAGVSAYASLAGAIASAADEARAEAEKASCPFVQSETAIPWPEVIGLQRRADVVFTSSLSDGLNLVPLQTAIAQSLKPRAQRAVLITGRDAGVAQAFAGYEADGLVPVDPLNHQALTATLLEALAGRPGRVSDRLVAAIRENDALAWATRFLTDLEHAC